jgi:hypothetical protein
LSLDALLADAAVEIGLAHAD